jgi:ATP-dependent Lhr-like helicase
LLDAVELLQGAPLLASDLDHLILPARVADYSPSDLDELCSAGEVVWRGVESVGPSDGRIALYIADNVPLLAPTPAALDDPLAVRVHDLLALRGAVFFDEIARELGGFRNDVLDALWQLVWSGHATNDTLAPLRARRRSSSGGEKRRDGRRRDRRGFRSRRQSRIPGTEGRWSLLNDGNDHSDDVPMRSLTERQTAVTEQLIRRYGVLVRSAVSREVVDGGFAALYPILRAMEEAGRVRRGYFVAGMGGAQFASPGADEVLRRKPNPDGDAENVVVLAASDPANAYGAILKWPAPRIDNVQLQRGGGARVFLQDGRLLAYLGRSARQLLTFPPDDPADEEAVRLKLAKALGALARRGTAVLIADIDGQPASASLLSADLLRLGFTTTSRGLLHRGEDRHARRP